MCAWEWRERKRLRDNYSRLRQVMYMIIYCIHYFGTIPNEPPGEIVYLLKKRLERSSGWASVHISDEVLAGLTAPLSHELGRPIHLLSPPLDTSICYRHSSSMYWSQLYLKQNPHSVKLGESPVPPSLPPSLPPSIPPIFFLSKPSSTAVIQHWNTNLTVNIRQFSWFLKAAVFPQQCVPELAVSMVMRACSAVCLSV